jgi:hypothetical protein
LRSAGQAGGAAKAHITRVTWCGLAGLGVGALLGVGLIIDNRGGLAVLACAGGYLAGLLLGEFAAQPPARGAHRTARLLARRPADYVPRWAVAAAVLAAAMVLAAPIAFALAPSVAYGSWQPATGVILPGGRTSWPPVFPGTVAAAALALAVLGVGAAGLRRVAGRPAAADDAAHGVDETLRRQSGRAILGAVLGIEMLVLAALLIAGSAGLAVPDQAAGPGAYLGNRVMVFTGLGCAACGLAAWLVLSGWIRRPHSRPAAATPGVTPGP